jgi:exosome complex component RRP40
MQQQDSQEQNIFIFPGEKYDLRHDLIANNTFKVNQQKLQAKKFLSIQVSKNSSKTSNISNSQDNTITTFNSRLTGNYYTPQVNDFIIGTISSKSSEYYKIDIGTYTHALLGSTEFEGASKKIKPNLKIGDLIFAKVIKINKYDAPILSCVSESGSKSWSTGESYFGNLAVGKVIHFPLHKVAFLLSEESKKVFKRIGDAIEFEYVLGHNGRMLVVVKNVEDEYECYDRIERVVAEWCGRKDAGGVEKLINELFVKMVEKSNKDKIKNKDTYKTGEEYERGGMDKGSGKRGKRSNY